MDSREIFEETVRLFAHAELSPRISEEMNEIYVHAPLGKVYENADIFVRFAKEYYTVEAFVQTDGVKDETELLRLINTINLSSDECTFTTDSNGVCCRYTLYFCGAVAELVRSSIYMPLFMLNRFAPAIKAVCDGTDSYSEAYEKLFT